MTVSRLPYRSFAALALLSLITACSLPRIVVLHDPLSAEEHLRLGGIYASQGRNDLALEQYRAAVRQDRKNVRAWERLADLSFRMQDYPEAEKAYEEALDLEPGNGDHANNLAWVFASQDKKLARARELVTQALALTPSHRPYYLDTLGVILLKQGKASEAVNVLEESVATIPSAQQEFLAEAFLHLANACAASRNNDRAREAREQYLRLRSVSTSTARVNGDDGAAPAP